MGKVEVLKSTKLNKWGIAENCRSEGKAKHTSRMEDSERYSNATGKDLEITVKNKPCQQSEAVVNKKNSA